MGLNKSISASSLLTRTYFCASVLFVSAVSVYATYATYQVARQSAKNMLRSCHDSVSAGTCHVLKSGGLPPPPRISILYLYCCSKRGQNQGIFPAFEDTFRLTKRSPRTTSVLFSDKNLMSKTNQTYRNRGGYTTAFAMAFATAAHKPDLRPINESGFYCSPRICFTVPAK